MDVELLSRIQFAVTVGFHYIYPPMSIGLGIILVIMEGMYLKTGNKLYEKMTKFWVKVFALTFAIGVATGIVMEFEFGTNWSNYSRFVGDIFGSALAAEAIFAFFLESGFLAILVFGWNKVGPKMHFFSTCMVSLGSMFSAVWIIVANSFMQTPTGYHVVGEGNAARAEIVDFWAMVFSPSTVDRLTHTLGGAFLTGAALVISVSAYYLLKNKHHDFAKSSIKIGLIVASISIILQATTGHSSAMGVAENQPAKLAAMEANYDDSTPADLYLFGWVNEENQKVSFGIKIPGMLSYLVTGDFNKPIKGLNSFREDERPPVNITFQAYHIMLAVGAFLLIINLLALFMWWRGSLFDNKLMLKILVFTVIVPHLGNQFGWIAAEVGRQPWIVYGLLKTKDGISPVVEAGQVWFSLALFSFIYILLFILFIFLLDQKIKKGPDEPDAVASQYEKGKHGLDEMPIGS